MRAEEVNTLSSGTEGALTRPSSAHFAASNRVCNIPFMNGLSLVYKENYSVCKAIPSAGFMPEKS